MGNTNEVVAEFITEEEFNELLRREKHKKLKEAQILFRDKMKKIYHNNDLSYYYSNIKIYRNENSELQSLNDLNKFLNYDTYELVRDTTYLGKSYRVAMCNYIYKWYSNSKSNM